MAAERVPTQYVSRLLTCLPALYVEEEPPSTCFHLPDSQEVTEQFRVGFLPADLGCVL